MWHAVPKRSPDEIFSAEESLCCVSPFIPRALYLLPSSFNHQDRETAHFRLSPSDFVQRAVLVLSRGKVIMKLSHCQQPYWIDRQKTEGTLCLRLAKPEGSGVTMACVDDRNTPGTECTRVCATEYRSVGLHRYSSCGSCMFDMQRC